MSPSELTRRDRCADERASPPPPLPVAEVPSSRALVRTEEAGWLGRLAGGVVHELKNPLSTIHLNLELLREEWSRAFPRSSHPRDRRTLARLDLVLRETRRLDAMLKEFLRFTRADRLAPEPVELARLADEVLAFVAPESALRGVEHRREYDPSPGRLLGDPALLKQAILNLVQNAQDAMSETGGALTVRIGRRLGGDGREEAAVEVQDEGVGISADALPRLFELYRTTKSDGTGLGLATTKRIAEAHGGRVEVESEIGQGSRFTLVLPVVPATAPPGHDPAAERPESEVMSAFVDP